MASITPSIMVPVVVLEHVLRQSPECTDMSIACLPPSGVYWVDFYDAMIFDENCSKYAWMVIDPNGDEIRRGLYVEDEFGNTILETEEELEWSQTI